MPGTSTVQSNGTHHGVSANSHRPSYLDTADSDYAGLSFTDQLQAQGPFALQPYQLALSGDLAADRAMPSASAAAAAPTTPGTAATALYLLEPGNTSLISIYDINQGQIGDCFLLASIGEIALWHPSAIMNMIHANADGTETVTLHLAASGQLPTYGTTQFRATTVTVTNVFPSYAVNNGATQDVVNGVKEIWVQVLEKAVATLEGGYNSIAYGGYPEIAMEELTGQQASWMSPGS